MSTCINNASICSVWQRIDYLQIVTIYWQCIAFTLQIWQHYHRITGVVTLQLWHVLFVWSLVCSVQEDKPCLKRIRRYLLSCWGAVGAVGPSQQGHRRNPPLPWTDRSLSNNRREGPYQASLKVLCSGKIFKYYYMWRYKYIVLRSFWVHCHMSNYCVQHNSEEPSHIHVHSLGLCYLVAWLYLNMHIIMRLCRISRKMQLVKYLQPYSNTTQNQSQLGIEMLQGVQLHLVAGRTLHH